MYRSYGIIGNNFVNSHALSDIRWIYYDIKYSQSVWLLARMTYIRFWINGTISLCRLWFPVKRISETVYLYTIVNHLFAVLVDPNSYIWWRIKQFLELNTLCKLQSMCCELNMNVRVTKTTGKREWNSGRMPKKCINDSWKRTCSKLT